MTCHSTDPLVEVPPGAKAPAPTTDTRECCGALILVQREWMRVQACREFNVYRRAHSSGLTKLGAQKLVERYLFLDPDGPMALPDLGQEGISR